MIQKDFKSSRGLSYLQYIVIFEIFIDLCNIKSDALKHDMLYLIGSKCTDLLV